MSFADHYCSARTSSNLRAKAEETCDLDYLGAAAIAGKDRLSDGRPGTPLGMALMRLFIGDDRQARELVEIMSTMVWNKSFAIEVRVKRQEADDIAKSVLAWHREGVCVPCEGHGYEVIGKEGGRKVVTDKACPSCRGTGRILFEKQFPVRLLPLAQWLLAEVQREQSKAGPAAMAALAPMLEF